jgi:hypothetical protein
MPEPHPASLAPAPAQGPRTPHWLTPKRLKAYSIILIAAQALIALAWLSTTNEGVDGKGKPIGYDFITFWSASALSLEGDPAATYDPARIFAASHRAVPANRAVFIWSYPPIFHLIVLPLALLPYLAAYAWWSALTFAPYLAVVLRWAPAPITLWPAVAFPGAFLNLMQGQNGALSAALFGGAMLCLERRPRLAGILIGLMTYKPHLGILIPLALLCGRRWQALIAAALTTIVLAALSAAVLGPDPWIAFARNVAFAGKVLDAGTLPLHKMPSVFASLRLLGAPSPLALGLHAVGALAVAALVGFLWWRQTPLPLAAAALITGSLLVPPHVNDHDLVLLAVPIALLAWDGYHRGWHAGEREILALAWLCPLIAAPLAAHAGIQIALAAMAALLAVATRRALWPPKRPVDMALPPAPRPAPAAASA